MAFVGSRIWSGFPEPRFICGKNRVSPGQMDPELFFFSGCTLRCVYCQNYHIANSEVGKTVSVERLSEIFLELQEQGANNINLVTPTHFVPQIIAALDQARKKGFNLPIVYNTSGYEKVETLRRLKWIC